MNKPLSVRLLLAVFFLGFLGWMASCSSDGDGDATPDLSFAGSYALSSAQLVTSGTAVDTLLADLLLADSPCDSANLSDFPLIQLVEGATANQGTINIACAISSATQSQGTWTYNVNQNLQLNVNVPLSPVPFPLTLGNLQIAFDQNNVVQQIQGQVDLSGIPTLGITELVQIVFDRIN